MLCCLVIFVPAEHMARILAQVYGQRFQLKALMQLLNFGLQQDCCTRLGRAGSMDGDGWIVWVQHGSVGPFRVSTTISFKFKHILWFLSFGPFL